jgi:2',3'-cyclic-nucleotide 2'-phosphodiesterase (5'-nucleotidase family)
VFVAITHLGVTSTSAGPLIDFAKKVDGYDLILGDHTDVQFSGTINNALVVENRSKGLTYARIRLTFYRQIGRVTDRSSEFVTPLASKDVTPDPAVQALIDGLKAQLAPILNTVVGSSRVAIPQADACGQSRGRTCESKIGNVIADAMRVTYGTDFAITNAGGLRADLTCPTIDNPNDFCPIHFPPPSNITQGQVLTVLPFGNVVVTLQVDGAELKTILENGVSRMPTADGRFPQVSGLCFTYDIASPAGNRVKKVVRQAADGTCTGAFVNLTAGSSYTLAMNDFMASGGDSYPTLSSRATTRDTMDQVVAQYIWANPQLSPAIQGRIVCTTSGFVACPAVQP